MAGPEMAGSSPPLDPLEDLRAIPNPQDRLMWITDRGRSLACFPEEERNDQNRVPGCVSAVWMIDESRLGRCAFRGDADAPVLRGLVRLICDHVNGRACDAVARDETDVIVALDIERQLTPTRVHGLRSLQAFIRNCARSHTIAKP